MNGKVPLKKTSPMCSTLACSKWTIVSPSVWACSTWKAWMTSPLHYQGAGFTEVLVAAGVVAVPMGVEDETNRPLVDSLDRRPDLVGQRRVLIVDQKDPVSACRDGDVAAGALEHVDPVRDFCRGDLNLGKVLLRPRGHGHYGNKYTKYG